MDKKTKKEQETEEMLAAKEAKRSDTMALAVYTSTGDYVRTYVGEKAVENAEMYAKKIGGKVKKVA